MTELFLKLDDIIRSLSLHYEEGIPPLSDERVKSYCAKHELTIYDFCQLFARRVASQYLSGILDFTTADVAMNSIENYVLGTYEVTLPSFAYDVYLAFDQGEYRHKGDADTVDSAEKYTKPRLQALFTLERVLKNAELIQ
jgi:hypothetical protein